MCVRSHECVHSHTYIHTYTCMVHMYHSTCVEVRELLGVTLSFHLVDSAEQMQLLRLGTL